MYDMFFHIFPKIFLDNKQLRLIIMFFEKYKIINNNFIVHIIVCDKISSKNVLIEKLLFSVTYYCN